MTIAVWIKTTSYLILGIGVLILSFFIAPLFMDIMDPITKLARNSIRPLFCEGNIKCNALCCGFILLYAIYLFFLLPIAVYFYIKRNKYIYIGIILLYFGSVCGTEVYVAITSGV